MKNKQAITLVIKLPRQRRRAVELYDQDSPFRGRVERNRRAYSRRQRHVNRDWDSE